MKGKALYPRTILMKLSLGFFILLHCGNDTSFSQTGLSEKGRDLLIIDKLISPVQYIIPWSNNQPEIKI